MAKYRILTFDGGGIRGALSIALLRRICQWFPRFVDSVDLFAGTSTGALIALALAYGHSPQSVETLYSEEVGRYIFTSRYVELARPKYDNLHLWNVLASVFPPNLRLKDIAKAVMVPSFNVSPQAGNWTPVFFNNYPRSTTRNALVIDVALASSAAPVYFPSYKGYIDGGVIANNPSIAAIAVARDEEGGNRSLDDLVLLSIGTGYSPQRVTANTASWGALQWMLHRSPTFPLLGVLLNGSVESDMYLSRQLLRGACFRLNPMLTQNVELDAYRKVPYLKKVAQECDLTDTVNWLRKHWF